MQTARINSYAEVIEISRRVRRVTDGDVLKHALKNIAILIADLLYVSMLGAWWYIAAAAIILKVNG
jgi:hypothetical protein